MTDPAVPEPSSEPSPWWSDRLARLRSSVPSTVPRAAVAAGVGVIIAVVTAVILLQRSSAPPPLVLPRAGAGAAGSPPAAGADQAPAGTDAGAPATVTVYAAGAVVRPGVYVVPGRARVADVVAAAGGTVAEANVDQLNLAAKVSDAERIYVPRKGEAVPAPVETPTGASPGGAAVPGPAGPIDLNTADTTQLDVLPGVGPTTAKAIVAYRNAHGRFRSVTDLLAVPGIGPAKLDAIRPLVTVTP